MERQDGDPGFRTTGTAAYPPAMCEALAEVIISELKARASEGGEWGLGRRGEGPERGIVSGKGGPATREETDPPDPAANLPLLHVSEEWKEDPPPSRGAGWWGRGPPVRVLQGSRVRDKVDGAGLCSPGRWKPGARRLPEVEQLTAELGGILAAVGVDWRRKVFALACGQLKECLFPAEAIRKGRVAVQHWAARRGCPVKDHADDIEQPIRVRLL